MIRTITSLLAIALFSGSAFCAEAPGVGEVLDQQFRNADREITSAVEAMPADKMNFAPGSIEIKGSDFKGVRTFGQQAKHLATYVYLASAAVLQQKPPVETGGDNGPDSIRTKEQIVDYVKGAFAYGHKALLSLTEKNQMEPVQFEGRPMARIGVAVFMMYHNFDHYGQMVEYLRMNGIIPPASRGRGGQ
ncbi:MAG TPA: DinB family protein [Bryobacteraceae bacterium]|nr:DinB family protein [Bryobacteraceae bacterium]